MDILPLIAEIKALVSSGQLNNQSQRPPYTFTTGQVLQATVISREAPNLFTLHLGGHEIPVETSAQLQTGQSLSVKVTTLSPQLQLQVVDKTAITQRMSTALPTMIHQGEIFSRLTPLIETTPQFRQLSTASQEVLQQMQATLSAFAPAKNQVYSLVEHIGSALLRSTAADTTTAGTLNTPPTVSQLLQQLASDPAFPPPLRATAAGLAKTYSAAQFSGKTTISLANNGPMPALTVAPSANAELRQQVSALNPSLQAVLLPVIDQLGPLFSSEEGRATEQLLSFLIQVGTTIKTSENLPLDGRQLQQSLHKLGLNMEHLLLEGKAEEAAGTLKFALLELANLSTTNQSHLHQIDELLGSIQFSQLMQMRLSQESLFFLPLPFPYLQSGFLLIEDKTNLDSSSSEQKSQSGPNGGVDMYLQLEGLGNLHIAIGQEKDMISLTFYSQDSERAKFIGENREALQQMLTTGSLYSAQFLVGVKEPVKVLIEKLLHDAATGMVNTVA